MATVGLCMIVKNEAHVIIRCLDSVRPLVDYVLVEDTGSTDGTQEVIREWLAAHDVPGRVVEEAWQNFAWNRTRALELLREQASIDFALIIDADDTLGFDPETDVAAFKAGLVADLLDVEIRHGGVRHHRPHLCRNALAFSYRGVVHEFLEVPPEARRRDTARGVYIRIEGGGARSQEPGKFERDAHVLEAALQTERDPFMRSRYTFYLAQSWRDAGQPERALGRYLERAQQGFWQDEVFISLYQAARLMEQLGHHEDIVIAAYLRAAAAQPQRAEALHGASRYCRTRGRNEQGWRIAAKGIELQPPETGLFVERWIYQFGLLDEFAVNAYWSGRYQDCLDACLRILEATDVDPATARRAAANARFANDKLREERAAAPLPMVQIAILAKDKAGHLPLYLACIQALDYPSDRIGLYIRTNNNTDNTASVLREWLGTVRDRYAEVEFDDTDLPERVQDYAPHDWNALRFSVLGRIRQQSLERARTKGYAFYFVIDVDNFVFPSTLRRLVDLNLPIVAPLLRCADSGRGAYANFHHDVDANGCYRHSDTYDRILARSEPGVHQVAVAHCTYLVRADVIDRLRYDDGSGRYEYVIFSDSARKTDTAQYLDNREIYGWLTFADDDTAVRRYFTERGIASRLPPPVHVINLDRSVSRWERFQANNDLGSRVHRFSAIDGATIDREALMSASILADGLSYGNGTLGCALSHIDLWRKCADEETPLTIFEDDTHAHPRFRALSSRLFSELPDDWDIVQWGYIYEPLFAWLDFGFAKAELRFYDRREPLAWTTDPAADAAVRLVRLMHSFGLQAYSISPKGARLLLEECLPLSNVLTPFPGTGIVIENEGIGCVMNAVYPLMQAFVCFPPLVVHHDAGVSERQNTDRD